MNDEDKKEIENEVDTDAGDDFVFEDNTEVTGPDSQQKVKQLKERIKDLEKKNAELLLAWQRDKADFVNARSEDIEGERLARIRTPSPNASLPPRPSSPQLSQLSQ